MDKVKENKTTKIINIFIKTVKLNQSKIKSFTQIEKQQWKIKKRRLLCFIWGYVCVFHCFSHTQNYPASFSSHETLLLHFPLIDPRALSPSLARPGTPRCPCGGWNAATVRTTSFFKTTPNHLEQLQNTKPATVQTKNRSGLGLLIDQCTLCAAFRLISCFTVTRLKPDEFISQNEFRTL